ncbi:MAG: DUF1080 domain-containing protein, partial [Planctomycetales bacterium]|nr:DUF1080 domain-containing protein [Planctomycetales bacterium]
MKHFALLLCVAVLAVGQTVLAGDVPEPDADGWITIFDGKTLDGWKANEHPESWSVEDGTIKGKGPKSHLYWMGEEFTDLEFQADVKLAHNSNSGMYFRAAWGDSWPEGYEAQVNNTAGDPVRTGSLYHLDKVFDQLVEDDTWWNQHIICKGNHIIIKVNGKTVVDFVDDTDEYGYKKGFVALQQHDPGSEVHYKNLK